jgi:hypothetical protein
MFYGWSWNPLGRLSILVFILAIPCIVSFLFHMISFASDGGVSAHLIWTYEDYLNPGRNRKSDKYEKKWSSCVGRAWLVMGA